MENYPFFKFHPGEWREGDISFLPLDMQGLFINICCLYWMFSGKLEWQTVSKRIADAKRTDCDRLIKEGIIKEADGFLKISFLDRQIAKCAEKSHVNSENGQKGAQKRTELLAIAKQTLNNSKPNAKRSKGNGLAVVKQKEREDKIRKIDSNTTVGSSVTSGVPGIGAIGLDGPRPLEPSEAWEKFKQVTGLKTKLQNEAGTEVFAKIIAHDDCAEIFAAIKARREFSPQWFANPDLSIHRVKEIAWKTDKAIFPELGDGIAPKPLLLIQREARKATQAAITEQQPKPETT